MITRRLVSRMSDIDLLILFVRKPHSRIVYSELGRRHLIRKAREYRLAFGLAPKGMELYFRTRD